MKICVYAICKNEEKFIKRWYNSIKEADGIYVLDTGSTDNSVNLLKSLGVNVYSKKITPWRFDKARNEALKLIPESFDICISLDLDEVLRPNWKEEIISIWKNNTDRLRYVYNWLIENNKPKITFYADKIHKRKGFTWVNIVHEVLKCDHIEKEIYTDKVIIDHYPDNKKSRSSYLPLLELSVKEDPTNDRNMHYLGREYMYYKKYNEAITTLKKHLNLKSATWKDERCASMRFIARCYKCLDKYDDAKKWLEKACEEAPYLRDPFTDSAIYYYELENYQKASMFAKKALEIKDNPKTYINEIYSYDETLYDLLSLSEFFLGNITSAIDYAKKGLEINPNNKRIKHNLKIFTKK